jgi:hypothetical protein
MKLWYETQHGRNCNRPAPCPKDVLTNLTRGSVLEACPADLTAREETEKREVVGLNPLLGAAKVSLLICKLGADSRYGLVDMD